MSLQGVLSKLNAAKEMMREFVTREKRKQVRSAFSMQLPCMAGAIRSPLLKLPRGPCLALMTAET